MKILPAIIIFSAILLSGCSSTTSQPATQAATDLPPASTAAPTLVPPVINTATPVTIDSTATSELSPEPVVTGDGKALMEERCSICHSLDRVKRSHKSQEEWATTVMRMIDHGAILDETEKELVIQYLSLTYPN